MLEILGTLYAYIYRCNDERDTQAQTPRRGKQHTSILVIHSDPSPLVISSDVLTHSVFPSKEIAS